MSDMFERSANDQKYFKEKVESMLQDIRSSHLYPGNDNKIVFYLSYGLDYCFRVDVVTQSNWYYGQDPADLELPKYEGYSTGLRLSLKKR